jgi:hypothetical protein
MGGVERWANCEAFFRREGVKEEDERATSGGCAERDGGSLDLSVFGGRVRVCASACVWVKWPRSACGAEVVLQTGPWADMRCVG